MLILSELPRVSTVVPGSSFGGNTWEGETGTQRASIINDVHAAVAVSIRADGGPVIGRGFSITIRRATA